MSKYRKPMCSLKHLTFLYGEKKCIHVSKYHMIPHKCIQFYYVSVPNKFLSVWITSKVVTARVGNSERAWQWRGVEADSRGRRG